ncbi:MAG: response regulator [Candidatus Kapaibacteriota bacterium]|jgi:CheY-like chemotaxis protein
MVEYCALIIDDDIWMQRILSKTLQSYGFRKTLLASDGYEGINLAIEHLPDIIILDILMPDLSGHQTLKLLRTIKITKNIPVLMVSALSDTENLGKAIKLGVNGFISKPFTRTTVFEKLVSIFGQDRLEKIAAGLPIDRTYMEEEFELSSVPISASSEEETKSSEGASQTSLIQEKISQSYKEEDEQKSIEAIKKLLLKTKKSSE